MGSTWERTELADLWGYKSFHALARGVFTPRDDKKIILFVKQDKRIGDVPYDDALEGDVLHWHGETGHGSDDRIMHAAETGDAIHLFYKKTHREPFTYLGQAIVMEANIQAISPSRFLFKLLKST